MKRATKIKAKLKIVWLSWWELMLEMKIEERKRGIFKGKFRFSIKISLEFYENVRI